MAKNMFEPVEIIDLSNKSIMVEAPVFKKPQEKIKTEVESAPSIEGLKREAEEFKNRWVQEKERLVNEAKEEAERIKDYARNSSDAQTSEAAVKADEIKEEAEKEAEKIIAVAQEEARSIQENAEAQNEELFNQTKLTAEDAGREAGWKEGLAEAKRLSARIQKVLDAAIQKRQAILEEVEPQMVELVLLICRKVIKVLSENQKNVVVNNTLEALKKLKSRSEVTIRVNTSDLEITTKHIKDFIHMVEKVTDITVLEDSSIGAGGAIVETDFGEIDARINNQLREIESKILEFTPISKTGAI